MAGKFALIIGNCNYQDSNLGKLNAPVQDVRALADVLMDPDIGGFNEVKTLIDRPFSVLQQEIVTFFDARLPDDTLLLYFSGHGLLDENGRLFLASVETKSDRPRALSIPATQIADEMGSSRSRKQVLILDCCHSGAYLLQNAKGGQAVRPVHTEEIFRGTGRTVLTASDTTEFAFESSDVHSVFTHSLVEGLRTGEADQDGDNLISVDEWYDYAYEHVTQANLHQTPMRANYGMRGKVYIASVHMARQTLKVTPSDSVPTPSKPRYKTWLVHPYGRGDFFSINEAIQVARSGDRIEVSPGFYTEFLVIDKPLEIVGLGEWGDVTIQVENANLLTFDASGGRVENLSLFQLGNYNCVNIIRGRLELERRDITSQGQSVLMNIRNGARPVIRGNRIHDGKSNGICVDENGQGVIEDNEIYGNANPGIAITTGGNPTIRRNKIHDGKGSGICVIENGQGLIEDNEIYANASPGIAITTGGNPTIRRNKIHDGKGNGIYVLENGQGLIEDNEIYANVSPGIAITTSGNSTIRRNKIHDGSSGIYIVENGQGLIEDNEIYGNATYGVYIGKKGAGTFKHNILFKNQKGNIFNFTDSKSLVTLLDNQEK